MVGADAGFALPEIFRVCERAQVGYVIDFASNAVVKRKIEARLEQARVISCLTGEKARLFDDVYYQAGSWDAPRRLVMKAEWLLKGPNPRFVITISTTHLRFSMTDCMSSEEPIANIASRNSSWAFRLLGSVASHLFANQFRLLLSQAAYV